MNDKNILFIGPYSKKPKGGVAFVLYEYKKLYPNAYFVASTISRNIFTKLYGFAFGILKILYLLTTKKEIKIVHIHGASNTSFKRKYFIYRIVKPLNKKLIYHIHGGAFHEFYKKTDNKTSLKIVDIINNVDCLVCLSNSRKEYFQNKFSPKKIEVIPNIIGINNKKDFVNTNNTDVLVFLFLGLIATNKGIWLLIEVLKEHRNEILGKAIFNIGGNGETQKLIRLIKEYELEDVVNFIGWVSGRDKQQFLQEADVYLLPSYNEGLPISILEAMSYSLPILSTKVGGIPEVVSSDNGFLISPGSKVELWAAINYYLGMNQEQLFSLGQSSIKKADSFLPYQVLNKLNKLYNTLLTEP
tara:strand:+ start:6137 stop:7207 length:1071 start_codon:yes stop_codon:yes gene_type:complete